MQWIAKLLRFLAYCVDGQQPVRLEPTDLEAFQAEALSTQPVQQVGRGSWPTFPDPPPTSNVFVRRPDMLNKTGNFHLVENCPAILGMPAVLITLQRQCVHYQTICQQCIMQTYVQKSLTGT